MIPLDMPFPAARDDAALGTLCKAAEWVAHHPAWQAAYKTYRLEQGNPWKLAPVSFSHDADESEIIAEAQRKFYKNRCSGGPILKIRRTPKLPCCPMCGSHHPGSVDHYLPRETFPEFSILLSNLIPACPHCNSGVKRGQYQGNAPPERFLHPYFDTIAESPIWFIEVKPPFQAAQFAPQVADDVAPEQRPTVRFHLDHILGDVFHDFIGTQWSRLPALIHGRLTADAALSEALVDKQLKNDLRDTIITSGINGWRTALLRGVIQNSKAIGFLTAQAAEVGALAV